MVVAQKICNPSVILTAPNSKTQYAQDAQSDTISIRIKDAKPQILNAAISTVSTSDVHNATQGTLSSARIVW